MKIYSNNNSDRLNDLVKARNAYVDELTRKKEEYNIQRESYRSRYNKFAEILEAQLQNLVNDTFNQHDADKRSPNYVNVFVHASEKRNGFNPEDFVTTYSIAITHYINNESRESSENSNFKVIFDIIVDNKGNRVLKRFDNLQLYLSGNDVDYSFLKCIYEFVDKLQNIDWQKTIDDIIDNSISNNTFPIYDKDVTVDIDDNTSEYDKKIAIKVLGEICGKDLWVKCPFHWLKVTSMQDGVISCTIVSACGGYDSWQQVIDYCHDYDCFDISEIEISVPIEIVTSADLKELLVVPEGSEEDDIEDGWEDDI